MLSKSRLEKITALKTKKIRNQKKLVLIEGIRNCWEAIQSDFFVETLLFNPEHTTQEFANLISEDVDNLNNIFTEKINEKEFDENFETKNQCPKCQYTW